MRSALAKRTLALFSPVELRSTIFPAGSASTRASPTSNIRSWRLAAEDHTLSYLRVANVKDGSVGEQADDRYQPTWKTYRKHSRANMLQPLLAGVD